MPDVYIFMFGTFVTSIFVAAVYTYIRVMFYGLEEKQRLRAIKTEQAEAHFVKHH